MLKSSGHPRLSQREALRSPPADPMYAWRKMSQEEREKTLSRRQSAGNPWPSIPTIDSGTGSYLISAACYEHRPHIGFSAERIEEFCEDLVSTLHECSCAEQTIAWVVLPNHYHLLCLTREIRAMKSELGRLHGRTSVRWNREEKATGRKVWFRSAETIIKSERHGATDA